MRVPPLPKDVQPTHPLMHPAAKLLGKDHDIIIRHSTGSARDIDTSESFKPFKSIRHRRVRTICTDRLQLPWDCQEALDVLKDHL